MSDAVNEELLVFFLGHAHLMEHVVVVGDAKLVQVLLHDEVLAHIPALEPASEVERHEPADHIATRRDQLADQEEADLDGSADRNVIGLHEFENRASVFPLIGLDLAECRFLSLVTN